MFKKDFWITFAFAFIFAWWLQITFFQPQVPEVNTSGSGSLLTITASKSEYAVGDEVILNIKSNSGELMKPLTASCPEEPFDVFKDGTQISATSPYKCEVTEVTPSEAISTLSYRGWNNQLFGEAGDYQVKVPYEGGTYEASFSIKPEGWLAAIWNTLFTRPVYNLLIGLTVVLGNDLGWAIVVLTLMMRLLLLIPSQQAMESQKRMQKIQPKMQELQKTHKGDQQKLSMETMKLMKENKVNPLGSCLPLLLQIPILLSVFVSIQNGLNVSFTHHLYAPLQTVNIESINFMFLGFLDLSKPEIFVLPWALAAIQFLQLRMSFAKMPTPVKKESTNGMPDLGSMNKVFMYFIPVIIAISALTLPAGVSIYWLISTFFSIIQQYFVNHEKAQ